MIGEPTSPQAGWFGELLIGRRPGRDVGPATERMCALLAALGDPHTRYPAVHITGTNGKGSTAAMTAALLATRGLRVGLYTSPHLQHPRERIVVDGQACTDSELTEALDRVAAAAADAGVTPGWFEALTAAGLHLFAVHDVDVAVVEVGMLGRWDATNVVDAAVAVVTNVELDHTDVAGPTRAAIAHEKAGIIKPGSVAVVGGCGPELRTVFEQEPCRRMLHATTDFFHTDRRAGPERTTVDLVTPWARHEGVPMALHGEHQCRNAVLAVTAAEAFLEAPLPDSAVRSALGRPAVRGRFDVVARRPTVVVDGAHNPAAAAVLRATLDEVFGADRPWTLVWGATTGHDLPGFLAALGAADSELLIAADPGTPRSVPSAELLRIARDSAVTATTAGSLEQVMRTARLAAGPDGLVVVTGSFHLIGSLLTGSTRVEVG